MQPVVRNLHGAVTLELKRNDVTWDPDGEGENQGVDRDILPWSFGLCPSERRGGKGVGVGQGRKDSARLRDTLQEVRPPPWPPSVLSLVTGE